MERTDNDFIRSSSLINKKGVYKKRIKVAKGSYLSHSLTFLQLLVQQPADIKAVTKRGGKSQRKKQGLMHCLSNGSELTSVFVGSN